MPTKWKKLSAIQPEDISEEIFFWLKDDGSLTKKLIDHCQNNFSVTVIKQEKLIANEDELDILNIAKDDAVLIREVELNCAKDVWVYARTVIPESSLVGRAASLANLNDKPLGAVLFSNPTTQRQVTQYACLVEGSGLYASAVLSLDNKPDQLWARRTLFIYESQPLLVHEVFLPKLI